VAVTRNGGTMADVGSVSRIFDRKGVVEVAKSQGTRTLQEDDLLEATLDADPEDVLDDGETFRVISDPNAVVDVRKAIQAAGLDYESAEVQFVPQYTEAIGDAETAEKLFKLLDAIEDCDDVQNVYSNEDVPDEIGEQLD
ncbi:MAG TPA: YebC/PmpR family DNA-binding transcriptional regulator, partial [Propionicimonas sp.]|nr:YebC/PmpR family DNA-binding transcriptional regulator [Propionicimonas sp.]